MATTSTSTSATGNGAAPFGRPRTEWTTAQVTSAAADRLRQHMFAMHHIEPTPNRKAPHFNRACAEAFAAGVDRFVAEHPIPPAPYGE